MNTEALLRKHFEAAAVRVEVSKTPAAEIMGRVRRTHIWMGVGAAAALVAVVMVATMVGGRSADTVGPASTITPTTSPVVDTGPTTAQPEKTPTTSATATTAQPDAAPTDIAEWTAAEAERDVEDYLAALAAGAYEQAAWRTENEGGSFEGQSSQETPAEYLARICAGGSCAGPYLVVADGPGIVHEYGVASSTVTVTHAESGESSVLTVATFEGQRVVTGIPPLVPSAGAPTLVEQLFGDDLPERVVVQRFDAFEIWENGEPTWVTNWWDDDVVDIEGGFALTSDLVVGLTDPAATSPAQWSCLMTRGSDVLLLNGCWTGEWKYEDLSTGVTLDLPIPYERGETDSRWFTERAGTVVTGWNDVDGNLVSVESGGVDLEGDDYVGNLAVSVDGSMIAYVDHADPDAYSHFWSPVVVVKDVATGTELGRWVLDGPVLGLEFSGDWVVAWEGSSETDALASGEPSQVAVDAINIRTGIVNRVETATKVFLPS